MMSMMGGQGMGAAGTGVGSGPMLPGSGTISPQILAMLMQMQQGQNAGQGNPMAAPGSTAAPGPTGAPITGTPMANYIGANGNAAGMQARPAQSLGTPPGMPGPTGAPGQGASAPAASGLPNPQMMALIQQLKGSQTGVTAGGTPISGIPNSGGAGSALPAWLQAMLNSGSYGATGMQLNPAQNTSNNGILVGGT